MPRFETCWECRNPVAHDPLRYRGIPVCDDCARINKTPQLYVAGSVLFALLVIGVTLWQWVS